MSSQNKPRKMGPMGGGPMGGMMSAGGKAKDFKGTFKKLIKYFKDFRISLILVIVFAILSTVFAIVCPKILGNATTSIAKSSMKAFTTQSAINIDFDYLKKLAFILIGLFIISAIFSFIQGFIISGVSQKITYKLRQQISFKMSKLPLRYYDTVTHGEILSRITNDVDTVSMSLQQSMTQIISSVVTIIGIIIMMLSISPLMTLIAIISLPLSGILVSIIVKLSQKHFKNQQKYLGQLNGHVEEMYSGHNIIKAFNLEKKSITELKNINNLLYKSSWKSNFLSGLMMPILNFVGNLGYIAVCVVGGYLTINKGFGIGGIQSFVAYIRQFNYPIAQTAQIANVLQSTMAAAERVFAFLDEEEEVPETKNPAQIKKVQGNVDFDNITFGYNEDKVILHDVNVSVKSGQTVAIVGPTGAGKTTIINLLMRFYDVNKGSIKIDGVDIRDMTRADLRKIFGMVLQDTWLFNGTIRENLSYGKLDASEEEIKAAAKAAHCNHFINTTAEGYDLVINEEASNLSQGQKQLLTIARAILADPPILILDEATSSVDTRTEQRIQRAMNNLMKGRTSFVIAHRLSTIRDADIILVMKDGNIIEQGNHEELIAKQGFYYDLYNSQFDKVS